jgi:hypothetical protein
MKKVKIKVSKQGLTRCPACKAHIQVAAPLGDTVCPFCNASLSAALERQEDPSGPLNRLVGSGRSALIAASLLGVPALGGCDDGGSDDTTSADVVQVEADTADTISTGLLYGMPADIVPMDAGPEPEVDDSEPPDIMNATPYGQPPEDGF